RGIFGVYGWTEVRLPEGLYVALTAVAGAVLVAALVALRRFRALLDWPVLAFFAVTAVALMVGLQWTDYNMLRKSGFASGFIQGRYLLPLAALAGLVVALVVRMVPTRLRVTAIGAIAAALVVFNVYSMGVTAWRFYA
ncbi:MAG: hypothetical protein JWM71_1899, partial [Solirubrobacteraceae bacterium]|nr:hypothetical protein [Solirubrobacteraceae bacterium]